MVVFAHERVTVQLNLIKERIVDRDVLNRLEILSRGPTGEVVIIRDHG
jgi:hypothetical protein